MKSYLHNFFNGNVKPIKSVTKSSYFQPAKQKENIYFDSNIESKRNRFLAGSSAFIMLFIFVVSVQLKAQTTDVTVFPLNDYLYTTSSNPYPLVNNDKLNAIDISRFVNVMDFGAKGDGKTLDDNAIENAFKAAEYGVIFPSGKTFLVSRLSKITLTHDLTVYAYGATIKMTDFSKYSFLSLEYQPGSYQGTVIWLGGKLNGNKNNQSWPGSPSGNNDWAEDHGRLLGICYAEFALVKDVTIASPVMDGVSIESCKLGVIADSKARGGAAIKFNQVQEQGTYFKFTRVGLKTCYFINLSCEGGSIGTHVSYPTKSAMDNETVSVHVNCTFKNQVQNAVHIEDCYKNFFYNCTIGADTGYQYMPSVHISNRSGIVSVKKCQFRNAKVNFNNASSLKLGIIDSCQFLSEFKGFAAPLNTFIEGRPTICINSSFDGRTSSKFQAELRNVRNCSYNNFDSLAIQGGYAVDSCSFVKGSKPANLSKGGFVITSTFTEVENTLYKTQPTNDDWKKTYLSYIDILSDKGKYLGRIDCGGNANNTAKASTQSKLTSTTTAKATARGNTSHSFNMNNVQQQSVAVNSAAAALSTDNSLISHEIKLYPNPTVEVVHVTLNNTIWGKTVLNIYDQQGRLVQTKNLYKNTTTTVEKLDVKHFPSGAYVLQIINEQKKAAFRFVVAK